MRQWLNLLVFIAWVALTAWLQPPPMAGDEPVAPPAPTVSEGEGGVAIVHGAAAVLVLALPIAVARQLVRRRGARG